MYFLICRNLINFGHTQYPSDIPSIFLTIRGFQCDNLEECAEIHQKTNFHCEAHTVLRPWVILSSVSLGGSPAQEGQECVGGMGLLCFVKDISLWLYSLLPVSDNFKFHDISSFCASIYVGGQNFLPYPLNKALLLCTFCLVRIALTL